MLFLCLPDESGKGAKTLGDREAGVLSNSPDMDGLCGVLLVVYFSQAASSVRGDDRFGSGCVDFYSISESGARE